MSTPIEIQIESNAQEVLRGLEAFSPAMLQGVAKAMDLQNEATIGQIQARKLSRRGPLTLGVITNRLRSSVRRAEATVNGTEVDSAIGSNVKYAGAHEFGFSGTVTVRAHRARHHALDVFKIRGKTLRGWEVAGVGKGERKTRIAEGFVSVRAHTMKMNIKERAPIRTTIRERAGNYSHAVSDAIVQAWRDAS